MLNTEQIKEILASGLVRMTDEKLETLFAPFVGEVPSANVGTRFGLTFTKLDEVSKSLTATISKDQLDARIKTFFGEGLLKANPQEGVSYWAGVIGSGSMNMNPCLIEVSLVGNSATLVAHAHEGLIKQGTCKKALANLEETLVAND